MKRLILLVVLLAVVCGSVSQAHAQRRMRVSQLRAALLAMSVQDSGTDLDAILFVIMHDEGLVENTTYEERAMARACANKMNLLLREAIARMPVRREITEANVYQIARYLNSTLEPKYWALLHGDDDGDDEWGYHLVQNDGATWNIYGENAINTVFDGIYHLGFPIVNADNEPHDKWEYEPGLYIQNEDGDRNASLADIALWLNELLDEDLAASRYGTIGARELARTAMGDRDIALQLAILMLYGIR